MAEKQGVLFERDLRGQKGPWAPGWYLNRCRNCRKQFVGDKRAQFCAPCAYDDPPGNIRVGMTLKPKVHLHDWPEEKAEVVRHDLRLGWYIVIDDNFGKWYRDEEAIWADFEEVK